MLATTSFCENKKLLDKKKSIMTFRNMGFHNFRVKFPLKKVRRMQDFFLINPFSPECLWKKEIHNIPRRKMPLAPMKEEMKAWQTEEFIGVDGIHLASMRIPLILKPSEVLIKVSAASVNPLDIVTLEGYGKNMFEIMKTTDQFYQGICDPPPLQFPLIVGRDFAGEVVRVGQAVSNVKVKDHVWGVVLPQRQGSHAEYVVTESFNVCPKPESLTDIEAASIPYVGLTNWSAAVVTGGFTPNDCYDKHVLIIGASGGIGTFLSQLMSAWGAKVVGICREDSFELVRSLGISEVYDFRDEEELNQLYIRPRFDLVMDAARTNDIGNWIGALKEWNNASYITLSSPLLKNVDRYGFFQGFTKSIFNLMTLNSSTITKGRAYKWAFFMSDQTALEEIGKLVDSGKIRPVIDKVFKMEDAKLAYQHVMNGPRKGKTVIDIAS